MLKKILLIFSIISFYDLMAMEQSLNPDLVFYLLNQMKNKDHSGELTRQFNALLAMNAKLTTNLMPLIEGASGAAANTTHTSHEVSKDDLLALTFKQDVSTRPITLVGDIPRSITQLIRRLKSPELNNDQYTTFNLLLTGEPGTGKSSIAQLIAQETRRDFYRVSASSLITSFQGSGANAIRSLFKYIREQEQPAVVFIDEIDGVANDTAKENNDEARRTVYELHNELDHNNGLIICVLATNHLDKLPTPLKTRFNIIKIDMPSYGKRLMILQHYAKNFNIQDKNLLHRIATETDGLSCRDLEKLSKEALQIALEDILDSGKDLKALLPPVKVDLTIDATPGEKGKEPETAPRKCSSAVISKITVNEMHYLIAIYTTQTTKLPNEQMRKLLFSYYSQQKPPLSEEILDLAKKETAGFSAQDIEEALQNSYALSLERGFDQPDDLDLLAGIYYKQKIKFADASNRSSLFRYFLNRYPNNIDDATCNILADHTVDEFTAEEIKNIVIKAHDLSDAKDSQAIEDVDMYVALHREVRKKEKPYKTIYSKNKTSHQSAGVSIPTPYASLSYNRNLSSIEDTEEIVPLTEKDELYGESAKGDSHNKSSRKDYRTKTNPNRRVRSFLFLYFISEIGHTLTLEQVKELIYKMKGFSWYSVEQFTKDAKDQSADNHWQLNSNSFFKISHKYNIILSNLFNNRHWLRRYIAHDDGLIATIFNQGINTPQATGQAAITAQPNIGNQQITAPANNIATHAASQQSIGQSTIPHQQTANQENGEIQVASQRVRNTEDLTTRVKKKQEKKEPSRAATTPPQVQVVSNNTDTQNANQTANNLQPNNSSTNTIPQEQNSWGWCTLT